MAHEILAVTDVKRKLQVRANSSTTSKAFPWHPHCGIKAAQIPNVKFDNGIVIKGICGLVGEFPDR